eukprot:5559889-Karenia_brevis.AAC.1
MNGVACRADETRSLACKNTDNKVLCKAVAHCLMPVIAHAAAAPQGGFVQGRHLTDNILIIDT